MGLPTNDLHALFHSQESGISLSMPRSSLPPTINIVRYSEDLSWAYHNAVNTVVKTGEIKSALVDGKVIRLSRVTSSNFYAMVKTSFGSASLAPFVPGMKYMFSTYIWAPNDFWWNNRTTASGTNGHGAIWVRARELTRVWYTATAANTTMIDCGANPALSLGHATNAADATWYAHNSNQNAAADVWIGGFQIEALPAAYLDGIAMIGDSRFAGSSGGKDANYDFNVPSTREVSTVLGSELRVPVYNRAIGGNKLSDMDARWATDISVLKHRCHAAIIQGGLNDFSNAGTFDQAKANTLSMVAKAAADGFKRVYFVTDAASSTLTALQRDTQAQYNTWLKATYTSAVSDIIPVLIDPNTGNLNSAAYGDGTHYPGAAKTAVAQHMVNTLDWSWIRQPSPYIKVAT